MGGVHIAFGGVAVDGVAVGGVAVGGVAVGGLRRVVVLKKPRCGRLSGLVQSGQETADGGVHGPEHGDDS